MKWLGQIALALIASLALLYAADWIVLQVRVSRGTAYRTVAVNQFLASSLKGNKVEYDWMGVVDQRCSRSIFPQSGSPACWWLQRHTAHWE